jgi:hypothetical protein
VPSAVPDHAVDDQLDWVKVLNVMAPAPRPPCLIPNSAIPFDKLFAAVGISLSESAVPAAKALFETVAPSPVWGFVAATAPNGHAAGEPRAVVEALLAAAAT